MKKIIRSRQEIFGMARVGFINELEVYVNTNDSGKIPHFHLRNRSEWNKFHTCIEITKSEYFLHGSKQDTLNASQRADLDRFMKSKVSSKKYVNLFENNWQLVCFLWDINNSDVEIPEDVKMPDYNLLSVK